jgi:2,3-bisphosphoglycerate-independent phosphoglycerate mutase
VKKILYILLDGLGDLPCAELENKTPLEAATKPHLDNLAKKGKTGLMYTVKKGIAPESDIAVISILGYEAKRYYTGRGPLECFAEGLAVNDGDLAYRVNFATLGEGNKIIDRRVGRDLTSEEATSLCKEINLKVKLNLASFEFKNTIGHRGVLVIRKEGNKLSGWVTNTDPAYEREGVFGVAKSKFENFLLESKPLPGYEDLKEACEAARLTNEFIQKSRVVLEESAVNKNRLVQGKLPANCILTRDGGDRLPKFPSVTQLYGARFGSFVEMPVEKGIALLTGMEVVELPVPTGHLDVDYPVRAKVTLKIKNRFDGLYIHIKGPDEPAHDGDSLKKKEIIEAIDRFFFGNLLPKIDIEKTIIAVTSDHSTPCSLKAHSDDPVPLLIAGGDIEADDVATFSEKTCREGSLGIIEGNQLMKILVDLAKE